MRIDNTGIRPRAERHAYQDKVDVRTSDGSQIETKAQDVSLSGMALSLSAPVIDNGAFVELHSESLGTCLLYTSPSPRDRSLSRMPSSA